MDWSIITPRISCGGAPDTEGVRGLLRYGHTHVLDLRHTTTNTDLYWMNFTYLRNPSIDDGAERSAGWFLRSWSFAQQCFSTEQGRLYIGCHSGINRAPSTVLFILLMEGVELETAVTTVLSERPHAQIRYFDCAYRIWKSHPIKKI